MVNRKRITTRIHEMVRSWPTRSVNYPKSSAWLETLRTLNYSVKPNAVAVRPLWLPKERLMPYQLPKRTKISTVRSSRSSHYHLLAGLEPYWRNVNGSIDLAPLSSCLTMMKQARLPWTRRLRSYRLAKLKWRGSLRRTRMTSLRSMDLQPSWKLYGALKPGLQQGSLQVRRSGRRSMSARRLSLSHILNA